MGIFGLISSSSPWYSSQKCKTYQGTTLVNFHPSNTAEKSLGSSLGLGTESAELSLVFSALSSIQPLDTLRAEEKRKQTNQPQHQNSRNNPTREKCCVDIPGADKEAEMEMNCCAAAVSLTDIAALWNALISLTDVLQLSTTSPALQKHPKRGVRRSFPTLSTQLWARGRQSRANRNITCTYSPSNTQLQSENTALAPHGTQNKKQHTCNTKA